MTLLILFVALAVGVSFLCSILEAVLLSVTPSYMALLEKDRPILAARLRRLKEEVDRPLAAILTLNTIAHTVGAAGAGAQATVVFGDAALGVFSAVLTFLILVLSEIIPKTIGATYWRSLVPIVSRILPPLILLLWPLVKMSQMLTKILSGGKKKNQVSREELSALATVGQREGVVDASESRILKNLLHLNALTVSDIMTPRTVVYALPQDTTIGTLIDDLEAMRFSRIPIYEDTIDQVSGFVLKSEILIKAVKDEESTSISELSRELTHVTADMHLRELFDHLLQFDRHIALVVDEFGGTAGIVTLEDVVETLLGLEIVDEADTIEDLQAQARKQWEDRAERLGLFTKSPDNSLESDATEKT
ncbi:CNNM domain-containing protein [Pararhizobium sp. IMCC21322]|uniref:CNNM domain-containing protein n=1 Tax=Pararhizobium sp. IMCC21322 TaxID=3067903 RepID=UPI0027421D59|nr:CNNM domain-containing protein [Pararhizobium sp. IMCC21322]